MAGEPGDGRADLAVVPVGRVAPGVTDIIPNGAMGLGVGGGDGMAIKLPVAGSTLDTLRPYRLE
jgi:hypothetical protein